MHLFRIVVLVLTCAMLALHLGTSLFLGRMHKAPMAAVSAVLRFEALYYAILLVYVGIGRHVSLLLPATLLAAVHILGLLITEHRWVAQGSYRSTAVIAGVRLFDAVEALALAWILWLLVH